MFDIGSLSDTIIIICGIAVTITTTAITIVKSIQKAKTDKANVAISTLEAIHALADNCITEAEKTVYHGADKLQYVLAKCILQFPTLDVAELTEYINNKVAWSKTVNFKEVK